MEIGWIDYSEEARQRTLAVLAALQEPTAIDELGIGIIRDAFANYFFPTTSTLFTKAKYLFLVPYVLRDMEREDNSNKSAAQLRKNYDDRERNLAIALLKANAEDTTGIIGARSLRSDFTGHWVKRGPAVIYWAALRNLGFCRNPALGFDECFRAMAGSAASTGKRATAEEMESGQNDDDATTESMWHIPDLSYSHWHDDTSMSLNQDEAEFLSNQINLRYPTSLYALLMRDAQALEVAKEALGVSRVEDVGQDSTDEGDAFSRFTRAMKPLVDNTTAIALQDAVAFSNFVYMCRVRYNAQLPTMADQAEAEWQDVGPLAHDFASALKVHRIYERMAVGRHSGALNLRNFLNEAKEDVLSGDISALDECIRRRERTIKHDRAKIGKTDHLPEGWRGGKRLSYRFEVAASFALDVAEAGKLHA